MCGIIGYVGNQEAEPILIGGLSKLEYRGYDSSGVAVLQGEKIAVRRSVGKLVNLQNSLKAKSVIKKSNFVIHMSIKLNQRTYLHFTNGSKNMSQILSVPFA